MVLTLEILFWASVLLIFYAVIGYPICLICLDKILKPRQLAKNLDYTPTVTLMIVAHNEEKVILKKLENSIDLDYPNDKFMILIASDCSSDKTNQIISDFIDNHRQFDIKLYSTKYHNGKTNAQNEAQKLVNTEIVVFTDANSMLKKDSIRELVSSFSSDDIAYVCGRLVYNNIANKTSEPQSKYWNLDLRLRDIESRLQTITAGNGAIYACRNSEYVDFNAMESHDSSMPLYYALHGKRAIFNPDSIAYENPTNNGKDEFHRKIRMSRIIIDKILPTFAIFNIFKYKWFTFFYLGHRTCRYCLWLFHILAFILSAILGIIGYNFYLVIFMVQLISYFILTIYGLVKYNIPIINLLYYYFLTVVAQIIGVFKILTNRTKPTWEKAESTR